MDMLLINAIQKNDGLLLPYLGCKRFQFLSGCIFSPWLFLYVYFDETKWESPPWQGSEGSLSPTTMEELRPQAKQTFMTLNKYPMCWIFSLFPYKSILHPAKCPQWMMSMVSIMGFLALWPPFGFYQEEH